LPENQFTGVWRMTRTAPACFFHLFLGVIAPLEKSLGDLMPALDEKRLARSMKARFSLPSDHPG
jgi:hypothetical protein